MYKNEEMFHIINLIKLILRKDSTKLKGTGLVMKGLEGTGIREKGRIRKSKKLNWTRDEGTEGYWNK